MDPDATQDLGELEVEEEEEVQDHHRKPKLVGYLKVFAHQDVEEKIYEIFEGENFIGRNERADVYIPWKALSKTHSCIEVDGDLHLLFDNNSKNKTRRNKVILKPLIRYELKTNDIITMADITAKYFKGDIIQGDDDGDDDTGSETGSESMLPVDSTAHEVQKDENSKIYAADTDSETDDEQDKRKAPVVYSSDEATAQSKTILSKDPPQINDIKQYNRPKIPNRMFDSSDDDDDEDIVKGIPGTTKPQPGHSTMMDVSTDSETLAFALMSPTDQPIIRPTSTKKVVEDTPATLLYGSDTLDKSPAGKRSSTSTKDVLDTTPATLLYETQTPDKSMHDKTTSDTTPTDVNENIPATLLYSAETQNRSSHTVDCTSRHNTTLETSTVIYETQGFTPKDDDMCQPTQAYIQESPISSPHRTSDVPRHLPDSEEEAEGTEPSEEEEVKKVLRFDDSATQAYSWNDSESTDDEDLRLLPTQPYPTKPATTEESDETDESNPDLYATSTSCKRSTEQSVGMVVKSNQHEPTVPYHDEEMDNRFDNQENINTGMETANKVKKDIFVKPTLPDSLLETQAYNADPCDIEETQAYDVDNQDTKNTGEEKGNRESKDMTVEPTLPNSMLETQAYNADPLDVGETQAYDVDNQDTVNTEEEKGKKDSSIQPTLPYSLQETQAYNADPCNAGETLAYDVDNQDTINTVEEKGKKGLYVEPTLPYSLLETQAYPVDECDEGETQDYDLSEEESDKRQVQQTVPYDLMETESYNTEKIEKPVYSSKQRNIDKSEASRYDEIIPDSEQVLSQEIPPHKIKHSDDITHTIISEKSAVEQETDGSKNNEIQEEITVENKEEPELVIRPARRGRGRVTQPTASDDQSVIEKPSTTRRKRGRSKLSTSATTDKPKITHTKSGKKCKQSDYTEDETVKATEDPDEQEKDITKSTRSSRSKKGKGARCESEKDEMEDSIPTDIEESCLDFSETNTEKPMSAKDEPKMTRTTGDRKSRKTTKNVKVKVAMEMDEDENGEPSSRLSILATNIELKMTPTVSDKNEKQKAQHHEDEIQKTVEDSSELGKEDHDLSVEVSKSRSSRSKKGKGAKVEPEKDEMEYSISKEDSESSFITTESLKEKLKSTRGKRSRKTTKNIKVKDAVEEDNGGNKETPREEDSQELPAPETKIRQKNTKKASKPETSTEPQETVATKAVSSRRGRGRVTQSDDAIPVPLSDASLAQLESDDFMSPHSVAKSLFSRRGKGKNKIAKAEPDINEVSSSPDTTNIGPATSESQGSTSSVSSKSKGKRVRATRDTDQLTKRHSLEGKQPMPRIMFTGVSDKQAEKIVVSLGGTLEESVYECTHLITDKVRRTVKFLCGVASGQIIVLPSWLTECKKNKMFVDPEPFLVHDQAAEKLHSFSLKQSHEQALKGGLLDGYKIHVTKNVKPDPQQMKDIIQCAKGEYLPRMPRTMEDKVLVVSCETDIDVCKAAASCGIPVYSAELLLTGILRQELSLEENRLFLETSNEEMSSARNTRKRRIDSVSEPIKSTTRSKRKK